MSASLFKPICLPLTKFRASIPEKKYINRVKRVLFEPIDHAETQKFLDRELEKHRLNDTSKWDFDFRNDVPLNTKDRRFIWVPTIHSAKSITFAPKRRRSIDNIDNSDLYPQPLAEYERPQPDPLRICSVAEQPIVGDVHSNKKQCKITDFMQARKRPADSAFKKILAPRPSKISREASSNS